MKIAIIGASGFLGTKLMNSLSKKEEVIGAAIDASNGLVKLDATNKNQVFDFLKKENPDAVIDLVSLTSSFDCEQNPELCKTLNFETAKNVAEVCKEIGAKMIFISSSYVFDGKKGNYSETDAPNPINQYGKYKLLAEKEVLKLKNSIVLRTTIMYGYNGKNKPNGVFDKILSGEKIILGDPFQLRNPLFVDEVPAIIFSLLEKNQSGIFHMAGKDTMTMLDFLKGLESVVRKDSKIQINDSNTLLVVHPKKDTLNISKLDSLGIKTGSFKKGIEMLRKQVSS